MQKLALLLLSTTLLCGCGSKPVASLPKPTIKTIVIVPATSPVQYTLENLSAIQFFVPIAAAGYASDSKAKAATFTQSILAKAPPLGKSFTDAVVRELENYGYKVRVIEDLTRNKDDPDSVEYSKLPFSEDAGIHLTISEIGLVSPRSTTSYMTRVNAHGIVFVKGRDDYIFDQSIYYGIDAREGKDWAISADETAAYSGFDEVQANLDTVISRFNIGLQQISKKLAAQIHAAIK
jgi:hypothetical protein